MTLRLAVPQWMCPNSNQQHPFLSYFFDDLQDDIAKNQQPIVREKIGAFIRFYEDTIRFQRHHPSTHKDWMDRVFEHDDALSILLLLRIHDADKDFAFYNRLENLLTYHAAPGQPSITNPLLSALLGCTETYPPGASAHNELAFLAALSPLLNDIEHIFCTTVPFLLFARERTHTYQAMYNISVSPPQRYLLEGFIPADMPVFTNDTHA